ncbi:MAG: biopolymer transporter ExbD [Pirellulales bacterium]|nr:biopolymer transporter ExbD [Pirellulales bacterium]
MPLKIQHDDQPTLNLTPMIDVVFLLIIFFMVATKFTELERNIGLNIPKVPEPGAMTAPPDKRVVQLYRNGTVRLDFEPVSLDQLTQRLASARKEYANLGVIIRGDGECSFQRVAEVLSACRRANVQELDIAVQPTTIR